MGLFSRKPPLAPTSGSGTPVGPYSRLLSPTPDVDQIARDLIAEHGLTGLVHPDDVVRPIMVLCRAQARAGLQNTLFSYVVPGLDEMMGRPDFTPKMFFDFLAQHNGAMVAATHDLVVDMLASPGFQEAMAEEVPRLAAQASAAAEREVLAAGRVRDETPGTRDDGCDARTWVSGTGLSVCSASAGHLGDHAWVPVAKL